MADEADITQERMEREEALRKRLREASAPVVPKYFTHCKWCGDETEGGAGFCTADCRDDHEKHLRTLRRAGVRT